MKLPRNVSQILAALLAAMASGCSERSVSALDGVTDLLSAEIRRVDGQLLELRAQLTGLPDISPNLQTGHLGYHGKPFTPQGDRPASLPDTRSIRLDLGSAQSIDAVVFVAVDYTAGNSAGPGYGFPVRFRVEAADDPGFEDAKVLVDHSAADFPNPRRFPVVIPAEGVIARYVRLTATGLWSQGGRSLLAMGEIMVLQGVRNLAADLPVSAIRVSDSDDAPPVWDRRWLVDGHSVIGAPQGTHPAPTEGFQSMPAKQSEETRWLQLDLGSEVPVHEIRLYPARAGEYPARRGFGFPLRFQVQLSGDPAFTTAESAADFRDSDFFNPHENMVTLRVPGTKARYVRVSAQGLSERLDDYVFALSEIEVFSGQQNMAAAAVVTASDSRESGIWSTRYVTDGFTSLRNVMTWPEYLSGLNRRREIEAEIRRLGGERRAVAERVLRTLGRALSGIAVAALAATGLILWRNARTRRRDLALLRQRLARDIHDEIGSGLGTISLISQMNGGLGAHAEPARLDFQEIHRISREVTESLRDIVWLIRPETHTVGDLAKRLEETSASMLAGIEYEFVTEPQTAGRELPLEHKRQVLMLFKEALHNIIRHSGATRAGVRVGGDEKWFSLTVSDNGCGFDPTVERSGAGVTGMRQRAETLGGSFTVESSPGAGTTLTLRVPWKAPRKNGAGRPV
jgi:signal transduction histidine kinase